jgi:hypothetical protein
VNTQADEFNMIEHRAIVRQKSFMQGRVFFNHRHSSMDCTIRDFTKSGGRLQFSEVVALPDAFEIYIPAKDSYFQTRVVWHVGNEVGVAWAPEGPSNSSHGAHHSADSVGDRLAKLEHEVVLLRKRLEVMQG